MDYTYCALTSKVSLIFKVGHLYSALLVSYDLPFYLILFILFILILFIFFLFIFFWDRVFYVALAVLELTL